MSDSNEAVKATLPPGISVSKPRLSRCIPYSLKISSIKNFEVFEDLSSTSKTSSSEYLDSVTRVHSELTRGSTLKILSRKFHFNAKMNKPRNFWSSKFLGYTVEEGAARQTEESERKRIKRDRGVREREQREKRDREWTEQDRKARETEEKMKQWSERDRVKGDEKHTREQATKES